MYSGDWIIKRGLGGKGVEDGGNHQGGHQGDGWGHQVGGGQCCQVGLQPHRQHILRLVQPGQELVEEAEKGPGLRATTSGEPPRLCQAEAEHVLLYDGKTCPSATRHRGWRGSQCFSISFPGQKRFCCFENRFSWDTHDGQPCYCVHTSFLYLKDGTKIGLIFFANIQQLYLFICNHYFSSYICICVFFLSSLAWG